MDIETLEIKEPQKNLTGYVEEVALSDIVQLVCLSRLERKLTLKKNSKTGNIYFADGEVIHAQIDDLQGQDAFYNLFSFQPARFTLLKETSDIKTIDIPWNFLLMEAYRIADEAQNLGGASQEGIAKKVMVVDDSRIVGKIMTQILHDELGVETVIIAKNGKEALELMEQHRPDFITLDINMTVLGGGEAIKYIMIRSPSPIFIMSGLNQDSFIKIMEFFRLGALDYIPKPRDNSTIPAIKNRLKKHIESIKRYEITNFRRAKITLTSFKKLGSSKPSTKFLLVIGGTGAFMDLQKLLPSLSSPEEWSILILQDMDISFSQYIADFFNKISKFEVRFLNEEASFCEGQCFICNWDRHINFVNEDSTIEVYLGDKEEELDINKILISLSEFYGPNLYILVLSGAALNMKDGLDEVILKGTHIMLQNPKTALSPSPLKTILSQEQEEIILDIEAVPDFINMKEKE
jgi:two-component system chemotaxis response regulator CheB